MNNINLKQITENLIDTFLEAGKTAKKISEKGVKITIKPDKSPVTDGDLTVDKMLRERIKNLKFILMMKKCNVWKRAIQKNIVIKGFLELLIHPHR